MCASISIRMYLQFYSQLCHNKPLFQIRKLFESKNCVTINVNMCFGCLKEPSHGDSSFEYPQHKFWLTNKKK